MDDFIALIPNIATETLQGATVLPVQSQDQPQRRKPVPRPRNQRRPEVTAKIPTQETGGSAQTLSSYFARTCLTNERLNPMAAPLSPETRTFRPRGWPADVDIRSKSVPNTLAEQRRSSKPGKYYENFQVPMTCIYNLQMRLLLYTETKRRCMYMYMCRCSKCMPV